MDNETSIQSSSSAPENPAIAGLIEGDQTFETVTERIVSVVLSQSKHKLPWWIMIAIGFLLFNVLGISLTYLVFKGVGIWGINQPVSWGWAIINFVWWIGIGHAGTLISAFLALMRQQWRASINRFAEAMTIFAVMCAGIFPALHTGRPWVDYWMFPLPNILAMWPQWRSPLMWDVFAVGTYFTISVLFWFLGLVPDFATVRDRAENPIVKYVYAFLSLGWRGAASHWERFETAYLILAGLSTPLVLSVHSVVSFDFSVGIVSGWHATIFPPYFVAGALYAGFAMVIMLAIPLRVWYHLEDYVTMKHFDWMAKMMLTSGLIVFYGYIMECFFAYFGGDYFDRRMMEFRQFGPYGWAYWVLILTNCIIPQALWLPWVRRNLNWLFFISVVISIGMWFERYVIVAVSLTRQFLPATWGYYTNTIWDVLVYLGTFGLFTFFFFLFVRFAPMISVFEMRDLVWRRFHFGHHGHEAETTEIEHTTGTAEA